MSRSRTGVRSNSALVCTLRTLTFHKVCEPVTAKRGASADRAKPYPIRRCERSVSEMSEAIFDCTGGIEQRKQKSNTIKSNIENN